MLVVKILFAAGLLAFLGYEIYSLVVAIKKRKKAKQDNSSSANSGNDDSTCDS